MNIDEFVEQEHNRIEDFKAYWLYEASHNSEEFPMDLEAGEWDEQLTLYSED